MAIVKEEPVEVPRLPSSSLSLPPILIDLCSSDSDSDGSDDEEARAYLKQVIRQEEEKERARRIRVSSDGAEEAEAKRRRVEADGVGGSVGVGFLAPLPLPSTPARAPGLAVESREDASVSGSGNSVLTTISGGCKQFWKAGDYEGAPGGGDWNTTSSVGMDHVRVHPKFLHSNATSHKWVLGAFAELLDNALDEVCNGATYVNIDTIPNKKDGSQMLLVEDNGGGMDPDKMRQCMSLGYSAKSKIANTIGQYGNGFKTSTMRLGADVIVFSRCRGKDGKRPTQSIGLLSYTFLTMTGKEDIVVPMLDYERGMGDWRKLMRSTKSDWDRNVETIVHWSPFSTEEDLLRQFNLMTDHGTRVIIYNLWEDDQGQLELDFEADKHDIQIRGVNRDEKNIQMATQYPNSRHFLTYRHSLRSYASILYLKLPAGFRIILRGKDVEHHNIINDMIHPEEVTYRPQPSADGVPRDSNMCAVVTIGFVKDAVYHIDVQGFNVYHKNRLIKPFWRLWNACGSDGRGVIGLLEANFVEPAHDKQGFERTTVLSRLENRLVHMQKQYWSNNCQLIGYAQRRGKKLLQSEEGDFHLRKSSQQKARGTSYGVPSSGRRPDKLEGSPRTLNRKYVNGHVFNGGVSSKMNNGTTPPSKNGMESLSTMPCSSSSDDTDATNIRPNGSSQKPESAYSTHFTNESCTIDQLNEENRLLLERLQEPKDKIISELQKELESEREKNRSLQAQIDEVEEKIEAMNKEQESLIDIFSEERERRDAEEERLRKQLEV
uniref:Morc S5 domain-containing protein n=1 Tax=Kalanchoe fedtschenkoi TaxID=63787 RepID=A0A7N0RAN9_KALFE